MTDLLKTINPATRIETEADARAVARASSIALWLSAARYAVTTASLAANYGNVRTLAAAQAEAMGAAVSVDMVAYGIVAGPAIIAVVEIAAGLWQWKRPGVVVPIIWLFLIAYGLFEFVRQGASFGGMGLITTALMLICAVLHISGLRGANAVGKFRDAQAY